MTDAPLVLSLPEVPEAAVALVGVSSGATYPRDGMAWRFDQSETGLIGLGELLDREGEVEVRVASQTEPRTWPKVEGPPIDLGAVRGASGRVYHRLSKYGHTFKTLGGSPLPFNELQRVDGPLEEVFG